ncbi:MAG: FAD:protein FMN transferase [Candidatus Omnitrophica bacterium]|nr:FAD:protein FMN transferase [Candidatus Omnitrophota bacterium]
MTKNLLTLPAAILVGVCLLWSSCSRAPSSSIISLSGATMGTVYHVKVVSPSSSKKRVAKLRDTLLEGFESVNSSMSHYRADSRISVFNRLGAGVTQTISGGFLDVMKMSFDLYRSTGGAFDITVGPLVRLWGFTNADSRVRDAPPTPDAIAKVLNNVGMNKLVLGPRGELSKKAEGVELDLSAIAKGYAVDETAQRLRASGYDNFMVEIGGEVCTSGKNAGGEDWIIGIAEPSHGAMLREKIIKRLILGNACLATSGNYENRIEADGNFYSHILDPKTGQPVSNGITSVSVIAPSCARADGAATAITVMGPKEGYLWALRQPDLEALIIARSPEGDLTEFTTPGLTRFLPSTERGDSPKIGL